MGSKVACKGTVTTIEVVVALITTAFTAPKYTVLLAAIALKLAPLIVTVVPTAPADGENEVIIGLLYQVKPGKVALAPGLVTNTEPVAPTSTIAVKLLAEFTINDCTLTPPKLTELILVNEVPNKVITEPCVPCVGVNEVMVGIAI